MNANPAKLEYRPPFTIVDQAVLLSEELDSYDKAVYAILCTYANNKDGSCFPSYQTLARKAKCSRSKAISIVANLESKGLIRKQEQRNSAGDNTSNLYTILPMGSPAAAPPDRLDALPSPPERPPSPCAAPELYPNNQIQMNEIHPSIERLTELKAQINYEYFEEAMPDKLNFIDSLLGYFLELGQAGRPEIGRLLSSVDELVILEFLDELKGKSFCKVKNFRGYIKKMLVEFLRRREIELAAI